VCTSPPPFTFKPIKAVRRKPSGPTTSFIPERLAQQTVLASRQQQKPQVVWEEQAERLVLSSATNRMQQPNDHGLYVVPHGKNLSMLQNRSFRHQMQSQALYSKRRTVGFQRFLKVS
jgi:FAD synthase